MDYLATVRGKRCAGAHLIIDLYDVEPARLKDAGRSEAALRTCIERAKATLLHIHLHVFSEGGGISGVAVLAESHISVHTWPEVGYGAFDVFMCGKTEPEEAIHVLKEVFAPKTCDVQLLARGSALAA